MKTNYTIKLNDDDEKVSEIRKLIQDNDGYCPCAIIKDDDSLCMCKDFRENIEEGYCHCGLYCKIKKENEV